jgi:hypothetical protein
MKSLTESIERRLLAVFHVRRMYYSHIISGPDWNMEIENKYV